MPTIQEQFNDLRAAVQAALYVWNKNKSEWYDCVVDRTALVDETEEAIRNLEQVLISTTRRTPLPELGVSPLALRSNIWFERDIHGWHRLQKNEDGSITSIRVNPEELPGGGLSFPKMPGDV